MTHPDIKSISDLKGKIGGISRFGSSTHQGLRYLFRANGLSVETDLKMLQLGADANRLAALKIGKIQYTFLGAAASDQARTQGLKILATAKQMGIPFPWTSVVVNESWLDANREIAYRYVKAVTEAIWFMKHNRAESERIIAKYMRVDDPRLATVEYDFNVPLFPDLPYPTTEGMRLILENLAAENSEFTRRDPKEFVDSSIVDRLKREFGVEANVGKPAVGILPPYLEIGAEIVSAKDDEQLTKLINQFQASSDTARPKDKREADSEADRKEE